MNFFSAWLLNTLMNRLCIRILILLRTSLMSSNVVSS